MTVRGAPLLGLMLLTSACSGNQNMFNPQGPAARSIATLGWVLLAIGGVVYLLVMAVMIWALARPRQPTDDNADTGRALTRTVTAAVVLTALILVALTISSEVTGRGLLTPSGPGAITVDVIGRQWWWDFQYRDVTPSDVVTSPNELHIPVGMPVVLVAQSRDVIHSFWVPNLQGKRDLVPGQVTSIWLQADAPGVYRGQCAEFCGHQHAHMALVVVAEPMDRFQEWVQQQRRPAPEPAEDLERRGRDVFLQSACVSCHTVRGTDAGSRFGPDLTHVASRRTIAAGTLPNTREHLGEWIGDAQSVKPGNRMPSNVVRPENREALLAYLRSLR
jgi:cytochrome c oxidase subunit II